MKVQIDRDDCTSCASCWGICPDLFEENPKDHFSEITEPNRAGRTMVWPIYYGAPMRVEIRCFMPGTMT